MLKTTRVAVVLLASLGALSTFGSGLAGQIPLNLGFERPGVEGFSRPWGWNEVAIAEGADFVVDSLIRRSGERSLRITRSADRVSGENRRAEHSLRYWIAPRFGWGHRVRVTGWVRAEHLDGQGRLVLEAWGDGVLASDTASLAGRVDVGEWQRLDLSIPVDSSAHSIVITAALLGAGAVWFDDLAVESGGRTWDTVPAASTPSDATLDWLAERSSPFSSVDAAGPPGTDALVDLAALGRIVGDARVVALGEATHGSSEFFRVKHRLLAYLVEQVGFRVFAIEANQLAVEPINAYVRGGSGEVRNVMRAMFQVWNTEEMRDLIEWMRTYNLENPSEMVEFIGFDMQDPRAPIDSVSVFLSRVEPKLRPGVDSLYSSYREAWREASYPQGPTDVRRAVMGTISSSADRSVTGSSVRRGMTILSGAGAMMRSMAVKVMTRWGCRFAMRLRTGI